MQEAHTGTTPLPSPTESDDEMKCMTLSEIAKKWFKQHRLEGFLRIVEAPPHGKAEKIVMKIDTEVITEEATCALIGLLERGIYSMNNPSPEMLTMFFVEYSLGSTAYRTEGSEDALFQLLECYMSMGSCIPNPWLCPRTKPASL